MLAEVKYGCPAWFGLLHPYFLLDTKGVLLSLGGENSTNILGIDPSHWELICSGFSGVFEKPSTPPERAIKFKIDFLPDSVLPTKR